MENFAIELFDDRQGGHQHHSGFLMKALRVENRFSNFEHKYSANLMSNDVDNKNFIGIEF